jgi:hypothetical protein
MGVPLMARRPRAGEIEVSVWIPDGEEARMAEIALTEGVDITEVYQAAVSHFLTKRAQHRAARS